MGVAGIGHTDCKVFALGGDVLVWSAVAFYHPHYGNAVHRVGSAPAESSFSVEEPEQVIANSRCGVMDRRLAITQLYC